MARVPDTGQKGQDDPYAELEEMYGLPEGSGEDDDDDNTGGDKADANAGNEEMAELKKELASLRQAQLSMLTQPQPAQSQPQAKAPEPKPISLEGLPDQYSDPEGYTRELNKRIADSVNSQVNAHAYKQRGEADQSQRYEGLWEDFTERYEDLAQNQDRVEFVAQKVAQRAARRGMDVEKYMFTTRDQFFEDVKSEYDKTFGGNDQSQQAQGRATGRTEGVAGGYEGGPQKGRPQKPKSNLVGEMYQLQKEAGIVT